MEQKKKTVFLIDDDQFLLNMYSLKFSNSGFEVATANTADLALKKLREGFSPDVMLIDVVMPTMDGFECIKHIKEERLSPNTTIVVLSNQGQNADIDKARELGVGGYIVKAATIPSEVVQKVQEILGSRQNN